MSRETLYQDDHILVVNGIDHALGQFLQIFDQDLKDETPEGEGLVLDWSKRFGFEVNLTSTPNSFGVLQIMNNYLTDNVRIDNVQPDNVQDTKLKELLEDHWEEVAKQKELLDDPIEPFLDCEDDDIDEEDAIGSLPPTDIDEDWLIVDDDDISAYPLEPFFDDEDEDIYYPEDEVLI